MKCPHCLISFHENFEESYIGEEEGMGWGFKATECPSCNKFIFFLTHGVPVPAQDGSGYYTTSRGTETIMVWPRCSTRSPIPIEVPEKFGADYKEACLVLADSPKASAALSRRCLQHVLREKAGIKPSDLSKEIEAVLQSNQLPSHLAEAIDAVRNIGNFAAHPTKSQNTGEIVDVEPGEAEWTLDVLDSLFDFYFVQPEILKRKRDGLNKKLTGAGKPPMK